MEGDKLLVQFIWLPSEKELPPPDSHEFSSEKSLKALQSFLSTLLEFPVEIDHAKPKISSNYFDQNQPNFELRPSMFYAEYLFSVTATINFQQFSNACGDNIDLLKRFIKKFCSERLRVSFPELYWNADTFHVFENDLNTHDQFIKIKNFSLGNIVKLNTFVEHFNSDNSMESTDNHQYQITQVKVKFLHDTELMMLNFVVKDPNVKKKSYLTHRMFQLLIPYSSINSILISHAKKFSVYIRLCETPMLYTVKLKENEEDKNYTSYMDLSYGTRWIRAVGLFKKCPTSIKKEFSMNTVVCLNFTQENYEAQKIMRYHKGVQTYFSYMNVVPYKPVQIALSVKNLDFECYYAYQCLISHSNEVLDHLMVKEEMDMFRNFLIEKSESKEDCKVLCRSLYYIHSALNKCNIILLNYSLKRLYQKLLNSANPDEENNSKLLHIKRAIIIPTHIRYLPPHPILKSRALRSFRPNYSIRISIRDVNLETINYSYRGGFNKERQRFLSEFFETNYKKQMLNGIKIGDRIYQYVGGSTSQLRGHGLWFYATDDKGRSAKMVRKAFGKIEEIKQVPKYMARMGQTFSQARDHIVVPQSWTNVDSPDEDIKGGVVVYLGENNVDNFKGRKFLKTVEECERHLCSEREMPFEKYNFSDGIGRISPELATDVYIKLEVEDLKPSAMQIRYAGCKGMLVVDPTLKGKQIKFRNSMRKFSSDDDSLEIIKVSEKRAASLNRPLITIMEQLGVPKNVFIKLQREMIQNHIKSMFHEPMACDFLNRNSMLRFDFTGMHENGIGFTEDPLFRSMIYALFKMHLGLLKNKANIEIPVSDGRVMFGVLDETFTLEYGQVFVQYTDWNDDKTIHVLEGPVLVTKNPCMHPGDVRKFEAVKVEALLHIRDCIAFPAKGPRPHPNEMAGSDLDGDEYHVMWYEDFIFKGENVPPMHFATPDDHSKDKEGTIEVEDELNHLRDFIVNDNVGLIASAHLALADKIQAGIFSDKCNRLAEKYAVSLDFAKSGKMATKDHNDTVFKYPDFMQKQNERDTYISKKVLGILFRNCKRLEMGLETTVTEIGYRLDLDLIVDNWEEYEGSALHVYDLYCREVEHLMNVYSFASEGELLAGAIINPPKYYRQRHDLDNIMQLLEYEVHWIFSDVEKTFFEEFGGKPVNGNFTDKMFQKASAYYVVAYEKRSGKKHNFFGLPWAVSDVLVSLKKEKCRLKRNMLTNCKSILEETIDECLKLDLPKISKESEISVIHESRYEVLDVAQKVLNKWWKTQRDHVLTEDFKQGQKLIDKEFLRLSETLACCGVKYIEHLKNTNDLKQALSPSYYVIKTLLKLAFVKSQKSSFNRIEQELSLLCWITLIKLACTYNPNYLGIADKDGKIANSIYFLPQDMVVSSFRLNIFQNEEYNEEFSFKLLHQSQEVFDYLKKVFMLKEIKCRFDKRDRDKEFAIFTVEGSRYAIEKLKDLVIQEDFYKWVVQGKKIVASQG